ncbi:hypothetical protein [Saccharothrix variisporea]|uniref:Uncharacterized protein n=1 Tax=Saccharothrix variisporea TaxID=543527 RepID=A0A495XR36_9PSEU|nr:hypothetical protein [Saccharothrix variisporea]RKT74923.1 hypothetical protein DFJ66_8298 [Saccharothrix variisporea]
MTAVMWSQAIGTAFLGVVGVWLAHNIRRQMRVKLAERQADAYVRLWTITAAASPSRTTPLDVAERRELCAGMDRWYFDEGNGVFMPRLTRNLFVAAQSNLICPNDAVQPGVLAEELAELPAADAERRRGCVSIRHLSLLRTQLKVDLSLHLGFDHLSRIYPEDRAFLRACGISDWRRPWRRRPLRAPGRVRPDSCLCGACGRRPIAAPTAPPATSVQV